jgi:hypothetical protein
MVGSSWSLKEDSWSLSYSTIYSSSKCSSGLQGVDLSNSKGLGIVTPLVGEPLSHSSLMNFSIEHRQWTRQHLIKQHLYPIRFTLHHFDSPIQDLLWLLLPQKLVQWARALEGVMNQVIHFIHHICLQLHNVFRTQITYGIQYLLEQCLHPIHFMSRHLDDPI